MDALRGRPLIELCCSPDSLLSTVGEEHGMSTCRITEADRFDLPRGLAKARDYIGRHPGAWSAGDIGKVQTWAEKRDPDGKRVFNLKRDLVAEWRRTPKHWPPHMLASALS